MSGAEELRRQLKLLRQVRFFRGHAYAWRRALSGLVQHRFAGRAPLRAAELSLGGACQLRCAHCYATEVTDRTVPIKQVRKVVDALQAMNCLSVLLVGGEPTLHPRLGDIVALVRERRMLPLVITNGIALDRDRLAVLRRRGLFGLLVSLLGVGARHDRFVGHDGAWASALTTLTAARDLGLFTAINTTATRDSISCGDFDRLVELARELRCVLKFNYPAPLGRWAERPDQLLDARERAVVEGALAQNHVSNDMVTSWVPDTCPAGHFALYVADSGDVTPCAYIPISFGNVNDEPLWRIRERMVRSPVFQELHRSCRVGVDAEFVARYIAPTAGAARLPVRWRDHPLRDELVPGD